MMSKVLVLAHLNQLRAGLHSAFALLKVSSTLVLRLLVNIGVDNYIQAAF